MQTTVAVPGFTDAHAHLLKDAAGTGFAWADDPTVADFHRRVARDGGTPMDLPEPPPPGPLAQVAARLRAGLDRAAAAGLTEITEMGLPDWWYLDALAELERTGPPPLRIRIYLASGVADQAGLAKMNDRRAADGDWIRLDGIKFYADGWLGPRTCAMCHPFHDTGDDGLLFLDAPTLARRIAPYLASGWRIATHAIGDRGIAAVLDAYELAWDGDRAAIAAAAPRIEHASVVDAGLAARFADLGVVACLQPSFAVTDAVQVSQALAPEHQGAAYPWAALAAAGVRLTSGTDYPIETLDPLVSLARLVTGRSRRAGFETGRDAPPSARLPTPAAFGLLTDESSGQTLLSADPRTVPAADLDTIEVRGTSPLPFPARRDA